MAFKTLYFLRHAKAASAEGVADDHERPLNQRGERDALRIGEYMKRQSIVPQLTLCSTSLRTRQTLHLLETGLERPLNVRLAAKVYLASPKDLLEEIHTLEAPLQSLMILGHNPTMQQLAVDLCGEGDEKLMGELIRRFPTATLAEIQYPAEEWSEVDARAGMLKRFVMPGALVGA